MGSPTILGLVTSQDRCSSPLSLNMSAYGRGSPGFSSIRFVMTNLFGNGRQISNTWPHQPTEHSFHGQSSVPGAKELSKSRAPPHCKFFMWTVLLSRCWTADRRHRHHLQEDDRCSLCSQANETVTHLLLNCCYSKEVWFRILGRSGFHGLTPDQETSVADWWLLKRKCVHRDQRPGFDTAVILVCWCIWKE
jgi:hypothetical protein